MVNGREMEKFCFVISSCKKKGWLVESKNVFKADNHNNLVPITFDESDDTKVYIRNVGVPLNNLFVVGSDDDPNALRARYDDGTIRIRTLKVKYSPSITTTKHPPAKITRKESTQGNKKKVTQQVNQNSADYFRNLLPPRRPRIETEDYGSDSDEEIDFTRNAELEPDPLDDLQDEILEDNPEDPNAQGEEEDRNASTSNNPQFPNSNVASSRSQTQRTRETPSGILKDVTNSSNLQRTGREKGILNGRIRRRQRNFARSRTAKLEAKVNLLSKNFSKFIQGTFGRINQENEEVDILSVTNCVETLEEVNNTKYLLINGVKVNTDNLSDILRQKTMRKRCNHIMREMWPPDVMKKMFLRRQNDIDIDVQTLTTAADRKKLRDACFHFQKRRKIIYAPGSDDDIDININYWMSCIFRDCRRKFKKNSN